MKTGAAARQTAAPAPQPARANAKTGLDASPMQGLVGNFAMQRAVQMRLTDGGGGDRYEEEADHAAETIAEQPAETPGVSAEGGEEEARRVQPKSESGGGVPRSATSVEHFLAGRRDGGASLPPSVRTVAESRLRHDFGNVRVHTDREAAAAAGALRAEAFTYGQDIFFARNRYQPSSVRGQKLLVHELTHVVQQRAAPAMIQRKGVPAADEDAEESKDTGAEARALATGQKGQVIHRPGVMACTPASPKTQYLRKVPSPEAGANVLATLGFNDPVMVEQKGGAGDGWYRVTTSAGQQGWVPTASVALDPPEPTALLYRVQEGETAIDLAGRWYGPFVWWMPNAAPGGDARFYVGALAFANKGRAGMPSPEDLAERAAWKSVTLTAGHTIWRPGRAFLDSLKGKVSSGSITGELWESVKSAASTVLGWLVYAAAFIAGILYGAGESIYDLLAGIVDLFKLVYDIAKGIIMGTLVADAMAFWEDLKKIKFSDVEAWFLSKWNAPDPWDQAFFRGRVVGYVIMEILVAIFTAGALTAAKWGGKFAKVAGFLTKLPRVAKVVEAAKAVKVPEKISGAVKNARRAYEAAVTARKLRKLAKQLGGPAKLAEMLAIFGQDSGRLVRFFVFFGEDASRMAKVIDPKRYERVKDVLGQVETLMNEFGSAKKVERALGLAEDAAHNNLISAKTIQEARVGLDLEARGLLKPPIKRYPGEAAEFLDGNGDAWDVKGFVSGKGKGTFKLLDSMTKIQAELAKGEKVIVDTTKMNAGDIAALRAEVRKLGLDVGSAPRVRWYP